MTNAALCPVEAAAAEIVALINSSPRTPSAAGIVSVIARAIPAGAVSPSPLTLALHRLRPMVREAVAEELDAEKTPAYEAACAKSRQLEREFDELARQAWARPVASFDDLAMRAEVALGYSDLNADGTLRGLDDSCLRSRSLAQLLVAVAAFAGCKFTP